MTSEPVTSDQVTPEQVLARDAARFGGRRVTVWGLGVFGGGVAVARFLARAGAEVRVLDRKSAQELGPSAAALARLPNVTLGLGRDHQPEDFLGADLVVKSPAVPPTSPWLAELARAGVPWTSELTLGVERLGELGVPFAVVTGSKGKSTTASLAGAMLGAPVAGNNERPLLDLLFPPEVEPPPAAPAAVVLEVSSFMAHALEHARRAGARLPAPAALAYTSLSPEHLNWHGAVEDYYQAKLSLLDLRPAQVVIPGADPELSLRVPPRLGEAELVWVATGDPAPAPEPGADGVVALEGGRAVERRRGAPPQPLFEQGALQLLGPHNIHNALTAAAVARALGASPATIGQGAATFEALPHRLQTVARRADGVAFVDDSTATTPEAAIAALRAARPPVVLLAGGSDKGADYGELGQAAAGAHTVVCLGEVGERIARAVEAARAAGTGEAAVVRAAGSFEEAFAEAARRCPPGGTVLLSPAAASYDMFPNFKARGERFAALARQACLP